MEESPDLLNLGLLFGQEVDEANMTTEELPEVLNFQHKLIQEFCAAKFIAKQIKTNPSFLSTTFSTLEKIQKHGEVLRFTCGLLAAKARVVTNHIGKMLAEETSDNLNEGNDLLNPGLNPFLQEVLEKCHEEGRVLAINPYMCFYPQSGHHLADCVKNSEIVVIDGVKENDPLKLERSSAKVMLSTGTTLNENEDNKSLELVNPVFSLHMNLQSIICYPLPEDVCKLRNFPQLKCFTSIQSLTLGHVIDLIDSINHWPEPELRKLHCQLPSVNPLVPKSTLTQMFNALMTVLRKCKQLQGLMLYHGGPLCGSIPILMEDPPQSLRRLCLGETMLLDEDVRSIAEAVKHHKLQQLEALMIDVNNAVTETTVTELVKACVAVRPDKPLEIVVDKIPTHIESLCKHTKITVKEHQSTSDD